MSVPRVRPSVVVAEDEAIIRLDLVEMLRGEGYDVVADCGRGDEAVELITSHDPDVALLDIKMPGRTGLEVARAVRGTCRAAVVLLTAFSQRSFIDEASEAGAMAYLVKPYQRADLVAALELARARRQEAEVAAARVVDLESRFDQRKLVDRAKAHLIAKHELTEGEAFRWLQREAMSNRRRMADVAAEVVAEMVAVGQGISPRG